MQSIAEIPFAPEPIIWLQSTIGPGAADLFRVISQLGSTWGLLLVLGIGFWLWGRRDLYALIGISVLEVAVTVAINQLFHIDRPSAEGIVQHQQVAAASFPSGHVLLATVVWGLLVVRRRVHVGVAVALVAAVGIARMYLGVHYLADVIGGVLIGVGVLWAFSRFWDRVYARLARIPFGWWAGLAMLATAAFGVVVGMGGLSADNVEWHSLGLALGGIVAVTTEHRYVRYGPCDDGGPWALARIALGLVGLVPLALVDRIAGAEVLWVGFATIFLAAIWALLLVPAWLVRFDLSVARRQTRRSKAWHFARNLAAVLGGALFLLLFYGVAIEPRLILLVSRQDVRLPGLPSGWNGATIAALSDFQIGMWWANRSMAERAVRAAVAADPDIVMLGGDFIYHVDSLPAPEIAEVEEILAPLAVAGIPIFAVLGNHDWGLSERRTQPVESSQVTAELTRTLADLDIRILDNEVVGVASGSRDSLLVGGVASRYAGLSDPEGMAFSGSRPPDIVLMHHPDSFEELPPGTAPLAIAGHTHGGQVALPFTPHWSYLTYTSSDEVHADGWAIDYGAPGNRLYVNRGIGFSVLPLRINAPPELTLFTLHADAG